uniref:Ig-like domain-containing protein n=1 Tax=Suricata suricatta TaxID=37032 RepID=A0A673SSK8_SURSU
MLVNHCCGSRLPPTSVCFLHRPLHAEVTQTPGHLVKGKGQKATLRCSPEKGHNHVYWYQQLPGQGLKFMVYLQKERIIDDSGMQTQRFSAEFPKEGPSVFKIQPAELGDTAVYLCASSLSTSMQSPILSVHEHPPSRPRPGNAMGCGREVARCLISERISWKAFCRESTEIGDACRSTMEHPSPCSGTKTVTRKR